MNQRQTASHLDDLDEKFWEQAKELIPYADPWEFPLGAFFDIYELLDQLLEATSHTHLEGRRGAGKTVLMVKAYRTIHEKFLQDKWVPPYDAAGVFIDLKQDVQAADNDPPQIRALIIYNQILEYLLTIKSRPEHRKQRRFWGLEDFINERPNWFRRTWARWHLGKYRRYLSEWDRIVTNKQFQEKIRRESSFGGNVEIGASFNPELPIVLGSKYTAGAVRNHSWEEFFTGYHLLFSGKVRGYLEKLLDAMEVKKLHIFLDEWSDSNIGKTTQPYLYQLLVQTFPPGSRIAIKIATITGATEFTFGLESARIPTISLDKQAYRSHWLRNRLVYLLLNNLKAVSKGRFPQKYEVEEEPQNGYPTFINDFFADPDAFQEFIRASENLPRQMVLLFMQLYRLSKRYPGSKLTAPMVRMAAKDYFEHQYLKKIEDNLILNEIFSSVLRAGGRVVDIELVTRLQDALGQLVENGILFKCEKIMPDRYNRYFLSYPADTYRIYNTYNGVKQGLERFTEIQVEVVDNCHMHKRPPEVKLSDVEKVLLVSEKKLVDNP